MSHNIIPGLAVKKKKMDNGEFYSESESDEMIMANSISYNKLMKLSKFNGYLSSKQQNRASHYGKFR